MNNIYHIPVLLNEVLSYLDIKPNDIAIDATLGGAGHSYHILKQLPAGMLIGFDRDPEAIEESSHKLKRFSNKLLINNNYSNLKTELENRNINSFDKILFDLGVSSHQLDADRGFSFQRDEKLDMRMDKTSNEPDAAWYINNLSEEDLANIIYKYGEERLSRRIAKAICNARNLKAINSTTELASIVAKAAGFAYTKQHIHPATRTFQALRIEVNKEFEHIEKAIVDAISMLNPNGIIAVISFHSLEDRIVKRTFRKLAGKCTCPPGVPFCMCQPQKIIKLLNSKPIVPSDTEIKENPRSRSSKLRCGKKLEEDNA